MIPKYADGKEIDQKSFLCRTVVFMCLVAVKNIQMRYSEKESIESLQ